MAKVKKTITLGMSGASGLAYGLRLLECLTHNDVVIQLLISPSARAVFKLEEGIDLPESLPALRQYFIEQYAIARPDDFQVYAANDWTAPVASGSGVADAMVVCPCSSGFISAVAHGSSNNLLERAADVALKERRPLILVHRETPLSAIHLQNMLQVTQLGATVLPASPGFYHHPKCIRDLVDFVVARILDHLAIEHHLIPRWGCS